jgi:hypothetical protein
MHRLALVTCAFLMLPTLAAAQGRSMGGPKEANWNEVMAGSPRGPSITGKDFAEASPLRMLLGKKKELKLTEAQLATIREADEKLTAANAERYVLVDSLRKLMRPSIAPNVEDETRVVLAREGMMGLVREISQSHATETKAIVASLDAEQQATAEQLLVKHAEKTQKMVREKLTPGGGGAAGGRGRGGRGG